MNVREAVPEDAAVAFYESRGYTRVTEHDHQFAEETEGRVVEMRKDL